MTTATAAATHLCVCTSVIRSSNRQSREPGTWTGFFLPTLAGSHQLCAWLPAACLGTGDWELLLCSKMQLTKLAGNLFSKSSPGSCKPPTDSRGTGQCMERYGQCNGPGWKAYSWCFPLCHLPRILLNGFLKFLLKYEL